MAMNNGNRLRLLGSGILVLAVSAVLHAQALAPKASTVRVEPLPQAEIDRIIRTFSAKETEFRQALNNYGFKRDATIRTLSILGKQITGEFRLVSVFSFDDSGKRFERILHAPPSTLVDLQITQEDLDDLGGVQPFALEAGKIGEYGFTYVGKEKIDELDLFVFDVTPKNLDTKNVKKRYFQGRIWVDDHDLMIVKARGKGVPEGNQRFPLFETYREQIDGKYWFPTYTSADDLLEFGNGDRIHEQMIVKFTEYKRAQGSVKIIEGDVEDDSENKPAPTTPPATPPKP